MSPRCPSRTAAALPEGACSSLDVSAGKSCRYRVTGGRRVDYPYRAANRREASAAERFQLPPRVCVDGVSSNRSDRIEQSERRCVGVSEIALEDAGQILLPDLRRQPGEHG